MEGVCRRRVLGGVAGLVAVAGCGEGTEREEITFFQTRVAADESFDVRLDFLVDDEVSISMDVRDSGTGTIVLSHSDTILVEESVTGPASEQFTLQIDERNDEFHELAVTTRDTPVDIEVTVHR